MDDVDRAMEWFERAIVKADGKRRYLNAICQLFDGLKQDRLIQPGAQIFKELISRYGTSYRILSFCADYLCELKEHELAYKLFKTLFDREAYQFIDKPEKSDIRRNRLNFAMTCLELDDIETCDKMVALMLDDIEMDDTARAVAFYSEIRKSEVENAIVILDRWIRERNIPIRDTINNFTEFLQVIIKFAETMLSYGLIDAGNIMIRSAESFASILKRSI